MTQEEILLLLLEEAQKYEYKRIEICQHLGWMPMENFRARKATLKLGIYHEQSQSDVKGYMIRLKKTPKLEIQDSEDLIQGQTLTIGKLTIIHQRFYETTYICWREE